MGSLLSSCFPYVRFPFSPTLFSTKEGKNCYYVRQENELPFSVNCNRHLENETVPIAVISTSPILSPASQNRRRFESVERNREREKASSPPEVFSELTDVGMSNKVGRASNARESYEMFSCKTVKQSFFGNCTLRMLLNFFSPAERRRQMLKDAFEHFDCEQAMFKPNRFPHISKYCEVLSPIIEETPDML
ncbi:Hypothetical predicted protein [Octopus vulgaris]|uniref:Uncharacterized protein n=1 Tax=Octopus vulgaris TaxID=6645 RepID=A0AA36B741_OCTVU|nr:Hypothetical predicted protein [Octopus vulgaris]